MTSSHHATSTVPSTPKTRLVLALMLLPFVVATVVGAFALWPESRKHQTPEAIGPPAELVDATVRSVEIGPCPNDPSENRCNTVVAQLTEGVDKGRETRLTLQEGPGQPVIERGDRIVLGRATDPLGTVTYYFVDFQRSMPLAVLGLVFAVLVVLVARWRGFGSLIGLAVTWLAITQFMLPSILEGNSPVAVALTCGAAIMLVVLYVAHGLSARTTTAVIGTLTSLAATGVLAWVAIRVANITGFSSDEITYVQTYAGEINIQGMLLAGIIIGSLGVLNDMTVTQASAVWEIHMAQPLRTRRELYASGMRVGRDHIASTVYTLVLAYVGATLPLLILFTLTNRSTGDVFVTEVIGEEVVRSLVGAIGIILSVPITTGLAAIVAKAQPVRLDTDEPVGLGDDDPSDDDVAIDNPDAGVATADDDNVDLQSDSQAKAGANEDGSISTAIPAHTASVVTATKQRRWRRRKVPSFEEARKMSRRERKFWAED